MWNKIKKDTDIVTRNAMYRAIRNVVGIAIRDDTYKITWTAADNVTWSDIDNAIDQALEHVT